MTLYAHGQIVRKRADKSVIGRIVQIIDGLILGKQMYVVDVGNRRIRIREDDLEETTSAQDPKDQFLAKAFGKPELALLGLTFQRLQSNLSNYIYSFNGSRTEFMPHQFKPLIKYLDSPSKRILIADEVGLGKTIEAGIILLEMQARNDLRGALIVCPANLCDKWRIEMQDRFELEFNIKTGTDLFECLTAKDSAYRNLMLITSYESLRNSNCVDALEVMERPFDITIADEAHRARNPSSRTHRAMRVLSGHTDSMLLLTATPVNNKSEDLLALLQLLDDSVFSNESLYDFQIRTNSLIMEVERGLRLNPIPYPRILELLDDFNRDSNPFRLLASNDKDYNAENPYFTRLRHAISTQSIATLDDRVEAQRNASKLNLLGDYINRTRRAEVQEFKPVRNPCVAEISFDQEERDLYDLVRKTALEYFNEFRLPVITFERMASSCLPAFIERFRRKDDQPEEDDEVTDETALDDLDSDQSQNIKHDSFQDVASHLLSNYDPRDFEQRDSKFRELHKTLIAIQGQENHSKVIIFSYFRGTLKYLGKRLGEYGIKHVVIHGGVSNQDDGHGGSLRRRLYAQFKDDPTIRVMLSSEVGSEGLDFQFSNVVVNYDLPWNPMVIEQRIGRIDRIGQEHAKLHVYAYILKDTIDHLIYQKLLSKISIFERCVGDLEAIVGSTFSDLTDLAYNKDLTDDQRRQQMEQKATAMLHKKLMMDTLDQEAGKSGSLHDYIRDELQRIRSGGRWLSETEMTSLVHRLLERNELEINVRNGPIEGIYTARSTQRAMDFFEANSSTNDRTREMLRFEHDLRQGSFSWTFDQRIGFKFPHVHLFNARHPAIRILLKAFAQRQSEGAIFPSVGSFRFSGGDSDVAAGRYLLGQYYATFSGPIMRREMLSVAIRLDEDNSMFIRPHQASRILGRLASRPRDLEEAALPGFDADVWNSLIEHLGRHASEEIAKRQEDLEADQREQRDRRRMQLKAQFDKGTRNARARIDGLEFKAAISSQRRSVDGLIRYWTNQIAKLQTTHHNEMERLENAQAISYEEENRFLAYCEVV